VVIKAVVFLTYWQSVFIDICAKLGLIRSTPDWSTYDTDDVAAGLQNFLICIEMFMAAVAHAHAFPPRDYMDASRPPPGFMKNLKVMFDVRDVSARGWLKQQPDAKCGVACFGPSLLVKGLPKSGRSNTVHNPTTAWRVGSLRHPDCSSTPFH
jgi:hypothetical protein